jgi:midasin (ATPase involved in ribosome maturation)
MAAGQHQLGSHVLTHSRLQHAQALAGCMACGVPVLLEGAAAVGKTSLVAALARAQGRRVRRVNNSESTTPQDYFGAFLPSGSGSFDFKPGPLALAMEHGDWLLIDEINLAPPSVMSLLAPLMDGQGTVQVPGSGRVLRAAPGFRVIATGNSARYAGRQALPMSLRNRLQVGMRSVQAAFM